MSFNRILSLITEIEQLKQENSSTNAQLETWRNMVAWQYWLNSLPDKDNWRKDFEALPKEHEVRQLYNSLMWFTGRFADVLPNNVTWLAEKSGIAFECWIEEAISEGYTESALCSEEAMTDAIQFVAECLTNGSLDRIDELKRQEAEQWELKLKYRRQAHEGSILPDGIKWLEENDSAFWAHFLEKSKPVEGATVEFSTVQLPEVAIPENNISTVEFSTVQLPEMVNGKDEFILAHWAGVDEGWLTPTADGVLPVFRNRLYKFSLETWGNIQGDNYLKVRWHEVE